MSNETTSRSYTLAELTALRHEWDDTSHGGIDPYEVDKFLEWLATVHERRPAISLSGKIQYVRPNDLHNKTHYCNHEQCVPVVQVSGL